MGQETSTLLTGTEISEGVCFVYASGLRDLVLGNVPDTLVQKIEKSAMELAKIDSVKGEKNITRIRFKSSIWAASGTKTMVSRVVWNKVLCILYEGGFMFLETIDMKKKSGVAVSMFLRVCDSQSMDGKRMICLSPHGHDQVRLSCPEGVPEELVDRLAKRLGERSKSAPELLSKKKFGESVYSFPDLKGSPWCANGKETVRARNMFGAMYSCSVERGVYYAKADLSQKKGNLSSYYFLYNMRPGPGEKNNNTSPPFVMSLNSSDYIRLNNAPPEAATAVEKTLEQLGLFKERKPYGESDQFELHGKPWDANGKEAVSSRLAVLHIFKALAQEGQRMEVACDLSGKLADLSTFVMRSAPPVNVELLGVSMNEMNKLRLFCTCEDLSEKYLEIFRHVWQKTIRKEQKYHGADEFSLSQNMWKHQSFDLSITAKSLMCETILQFANEGAFLYGSVDTSGKIEAQGSGESQEYFKADCDTLMFSIGEDLSGRFSSILNSELCPEPCGSSSGSPCLGGFSSSV